MSARRALIPIALTLLAVGCSESAATAKGSVSRRSIAKRCYRCGARFRWTRTAEARRNHASGSSTSAPEPQPPPSVSSSGARGQTSVSTEEPGP